MSREINSLYIHFPFCQHLCNYCDFYKHKLENKEQVLTYESFLLSQWEEHKKLLKENNFKMGKLETLYLGGGTPSLWKLEGVRFLEKFLKDHQLKFTDDYEFTLEVDPGTWTIDEIKAWMQLGVNRFSIGSQAFSSEYLKVMDRAHSLDEVKETLGYMRDLKANFSVDLMLGLPEGGTPRDLKSELDTLLDFNPSHLSVYILKARKNYPLYSKLPDDDQTGDEYLFVSKYLLNHGFTHYEVSNFAKNKKYSKHNLKYWDYQSVACLGANATGLLVKEDSSLRYQWKAKRIGFETEELEGDSFLIEKIYMGIRCFHGINLLELFPNQSLSLEKILKAWDRSGYLKGELDIAKVKLSPKGYLMCDSLMDDLFREIKF